MSGGASSKGHIVQGTQIQAIQNSRRIIQGYIVLGYNILSSDSHFGEWKHQEPALRYPFTCVLNYLTLGWARFAKKMFSLISEIKRIWIRFTCVSLFHYKISLLFFRFKFFASLHLSNFRFEAKQSEAKFKSIFSLFLTFFSLFFAIFHIFFAFFHFQIFASLRFSNFCFKAKQSEAKFKYIFSFFHFFSLFFTFFAFFTFFRLIFVSLRFFHLIFAYFTFVFASDFWCFASKWIMWNQAFFRFEAKRIFVSISNFASEAKVRAHPTWHVGQFLLLLAMARSTEMKPAYAHRSALEKYECF